MSIIDENLVKVYKLDEVHKLLSIIFLKLTTFNTHMLISEHPPST